MANLKKKIDGEEDDDFQGKPPPAAPSYNAGGARQSSFGRRSRDYPRHSVDHDRYDADPQVLGDDFTNLQLRDHEGMRTTLLRTLRICWAKLHQHLPVTRAALWPTQISSNQRLHVLNRTPVDEFPSKTAHRKRSVSKIDQHLLQIPRNDHLPVRAGSPVNGNL